MTQIYTYIARIDSEGKRTTNRTHGTHSCQEHRDFLTRDDAKACLERFLEREHCVEPSRWLIAQGTEQGNFASHFFEVVESPQYVVV